MAYRKGLVLEGGGAKGAYAFGWLLEFKARGVRFDAVAGTSVGALNAVLWASSQLDEGEQVWRSISEETTLSPRRPRWLWTLLLIPYGLHRIAGEQISRINDKVFASYSALVVAAMVMVVFGLPAIWLATEILRQAIVFGATLFNAPLEFSEIANEIVRFLRVMFGTGGMLLTLIAVMAPGAFDNLVRFHSRSSAPLRNTIEQIIASSALTIPTFATVAEYRLVSDPEQLRFMRGRVAPKGFWIGHMQYVPVYVPLHETPESARAPFVLASASLPYGITLPVRDEGHSLVDGGVADNSPVLPLISNEYCNLVVLIKLRPSPSVTENQLKEYFCRVKRQKLAAGLSPEAASRMRAKGEQLTFVVPPAWPELRTVTPTRSLESLLFNNEHPIAAERAVARLCSLIICVMPYCLAWLISCIVVKVQETRAMLSFESDYVARLIDLGRADAAAQSDEFWSRLI